MKPGHMERVIIILFGIVVGFVGYQSTRWTNSIDVLNKNVSELSIQVKVVVSEMANANINYSEIKTKNDKQDADLTDLKARILVLEHKK